VHVIAGESAGWDDMQKCRMVEMKPKGYEFDT